MRSKVMELLFRVLETSSGKTLFHETDFNSVNGCPINIIPVDTRFNIDGASGRTDMETLMFELHFKEGDPKIKVETNLKYTITEEHYKSMYLGLVKHSTKVYHYTTETNVSFGEFSFVLTPEEETELIEATKQSYAKHLTMVDNHYNKDLLKAVNKQLGYYGGAREN